MVIMENNRLKDLLSRKIILEKVECECPGITLGDNCFYLGQQENLRNFTKVYVFGRILEKILEIDDLDLKDLDFIERIVTGLKVEGGTNQVLASAFKKIVDRAVVKENDLKVLMKIMKTSKLVQNLLEFKKDSFLMIDFKIRNLIIREVLEFNRNPVENLAREILEVMTDLGKYSFNLNPSLELLSSSMLQFLEENLKRSEIKNPENLSLLSLFEKLPIQHQVKLQIINLKKYYKSKHFPQKSMTYSQASFLRYTQVTLKTNPLIDLSISLNSPSHFIQSDSMSIGTVFTKLLINDSKTNVIIKFFQNFQPEALENIFNELKIHQFLSDHSEKFTSFLRCFEIMMSNEQILMIVENFELNLSDFIQTCELKRLEESQLKRVYLDLLKSFEFMEKYDIFHLNLSLENILVDPNWDLKIANFKSFGNLENSTFDTSVVEHPGFFRYYSNDDMGNLTNEQMFSADVHALGLVFLQLARMEVFRMKDFQFADFLENEIKKVEFGWTQRILREMISAQNVTSYYQLVVMVED